MKKIYLSLIMVIIGFSGSAFKNIPQRITETYLVQTSWGEYTRSNAVDWACVGFSIYPCRYEVTHFGKRYIPDRVSFTDVEILTYLQNNWISLIPNTQNKIFIDLSEDY